MSKTLERYAQEIKEWSNKRNQDVIRSRPTRMVADRRTDKRGYFHQWLLTKHNNLEAVVEKDDGTVERWEYRDIRFLD